MRVDAAFSEAAFRPLAQFRVWTAGRVFRLVKPTWGGAEGRLASSLEQTWVRPSPRHVVLQKQIVVWPSMAARIWSTGFRQQRRLKLLVFGSARAPRNSAQTTYSYTLPRRKGSRQVLLMDWFEGVEKVKLTWTHLSSLWIAWRAWRPLWWSWRPWRWQRCPPARRSPPASRPSCGESRTTSPRPWPPRGRCRRRRSPPSWRSWPCGRTTASPGRRRRRCLRPPSTPPSRCWSRGPLPWPLSRRPTVCWVKQRATRLL